MQHCRKCPDAVAQIRGGVEVPKLSGCIRFYQQKGCVLIVAEIFGLSRENETGFFRFSHPSGKKLLRNGLFRNRKSLQSCGSGASKTCRWLTAVDVLPGKRIPGCKNGSVYCAWYYWKNGSHTQRSRWLPYVACWQCRTENRLRCDLQGMITG